MIDESGTMIGQKESECGHIGVIRVALTAVCTIDPPADILYAVDPVGVAIITPSAYIVVKKFPSMNKSKFVKKELGPLSITISFIAWRLWITSIFL